VTADIITNDQISRAADFKPLVIGHNNGAAIRLSDVADVLDSTQNVRTLGLLNGKPAILLIIFPGAWREHHPNGGAHPDATAVRGGFHPEGHRHYHRPRPHRHHPRLCRRRRTHARDLYRF